MTVYLATYLILKVRLTPWCRLSQAGTVGSRRVQAGERTLPVQLSERRWSLDDAEQRRRP